MIILKNTSQKTFKITMTKNPITKVHQSPRPTGIDYLDLDPKTDKKKIDEILNSENYCAAEEVVLKPGITEFENEEHAEYFYSILGSPEEAGIQIRGSKHIEITNRNFVFEVDKKGEEVKDNLYRKYRLPVGTVTFTQIDPELEKLKQ